MPWIHEPEHMPYCHSIVFKNMCRSSAYSIIDSCSVAIPADTDFNLCYRIFFVIWTVGERSMLWWTSQETFLSRRVTSQWFSSLKSRSSWITDAGRKSVTLSIHSDRLIPPNRGPGICTLFLCQFNPVIFFFFYFWPRIQWWCKIGNVYIRLWELCSPWH